MKPMEYQRVSHIHQVFETWKYVYFSLSLSLSLSRRKHIEWNYISKWSNSPNELKFHVNEELNYIHESAANYR